MIQPFKRQVVNLSFFNNKDFKNVYSFFGEGDKMQEDVKDYFDYVNQYIDNLSDEDFLKLLNECCADMYEESEEEMIFKLMREKENEQFNSFDEQV